MKSSSALITAVQSGDLETVKQLIEQEPEMSASVTEAGIPISLLAAYYRQKDIFDWIMSRRENPGLYEAAAAGQSARVAAILDASPQLIDAFAADGFAALGLASYFGQYSVAELLIERGADVNLPANNGSMVTPLHAAVAANSPEITRLLLENGAAVNALQASGVSALHSAAHRGNLEIVRLLLQHGAATDIKMDDGRTALDFAKADGHQAVAALLEQSAA